MCVRACVRACVRVRACVGVGVCVVARFTAPSSGLIPPEDWADHPG